MRFTVGFVTPDTTTPERSVARERGRDSLWVVAAGSLVVLQLWFGRISSGLWLDETGTWWIIKDGPAEAIHRALWWSGQSPLYYVVVWLASRILGHGDIALRIPSVLATAGTVWLLYRLAARLIDRSAAAVVCFLFICATSFFAIDARPYALGILCLTASSWMLVRWLDSSRTRDALFYVISAALVVYTHVILSVGLLAGFVYAVVRLRREPRRLGWLALSQTAVAILCLPVASECLTFYATRGNHAFLPRPASAELLPLLVPLSLSGVVILITWFGTTVFGEARIGSAFQSNTAVLILIWALFPPLFLFLISTRTDVHLFVERYCSSSVPGQAMLAGALLASIRPAVIRNALIVAVAAITLTTQSRMAFPNHGSDDWRDGLAFLQGEAGDAPVLVVSPFTEGVGFRALHDPTLREILFAPEVRYGEPRRSIRVPHIFPADEIPALEKATEGIHGERRLYLIDDRPDWSYETWLLAKHHTHCETETTGSSFGYVKIARLTCD